MINALGLYAGIVFLKLKLMRVVGRCTAEVELTGTGL